MDDFVLLSPVFYPVERLMWPGMIRMFHFVSTFDTDVGKGCSSASGEVSWSDDLAFSTFTALASHGSSSCVLSSSSCSCSWFFRSALMCRMTVCGL